MSTVTITNLPPGTAATSTAVNASLTSWNSGTAAGQIGAANIRMEGVDRRTMSAANHVVETTEVANNTIIVSTAASGAVRSTAPAITVVTCGIAMTTATMTINIDHIPYIHASISVLSASLAAAMPRLLVEVFLQVSIDAGATWTELTGTRRYFQPRDTNVNLTGGNPILGICGSVSWMTKVTGGAARSFRIAFTTTNDGASVGGTDAIFDNAIPAAALMSPLTIVPSTIIADETFDDPIAVTPDELTVTSPDKAILGA